jgi:hypothetical protein
VGRSFVLVVVLALVLDSPSVFEDENDDEDDMKPPRCERRSQTVIRADKAARG